MISPISPNDATKIGNLNEVMEKPLSDMYKVYANNDNKYESFKTLVDDMIENTSIIADKCNVNVVNNIGQERVLPHFDKHREFKKIFLKKPQRR